MKDTEIHNGLPEKEIRDFFSELIMKDIMPKTAIHQYPLNQDPFVIALNNEKINLMNSQNEIKRLEKIIAVRTLIKEKGWNEYDCSDYVERTDEHWKNFIGTEKEFKKFMKDNDFKD